MAIDGLKSYVKQLIGLELGTYQSNQKNLRRKYNSTPEVYPFSSQNSSNVNSKIVEQEFYSKKDPKTMTALTQEYLDDSYGKPVEYAIYDINSGVNQRIYHYDSDGKATGLSIFNGIYIEDVDGDGKITEKDTIHIDGKEKNIGDYLNEK